MYGSNKTKKNIELDITTNIFFQLIIFFTTSKAKKESTQKPPMSKRVATDKPAIKDQNKRCFVFIFPLFS